MFPAQKRADVCEQANNSKYINTIIHIPNAVIHYYDTQRAEPLHGCARRVCCVRGHDADMQQATRLAYTWTLIIKRALKHKIIPSKPPPSQPSTHTDTYTNTV